MIELGRQFGLYVIQEVITATDGFACCKAEDPFFNREVILKIFSGEAFNTEAAPGQLENQLEKLAALDHPSIAPIYDFGMEGEDIYFTSCPYYGGSLVEQVQGAMPSEAVLKLAGELTLALDYAIEHQLVQGKLLAEKIYLDSQGCAVITDFSIDSYLQHLQTTTAGEELVGDKTDLQSAVAETLCSLGELLLRLLLGPNADFEHGRIEDLLADISQPQLRKLIGRFLLPGEWRFSSFSELLEELAGFTEVAALVKENTAKQQRLESISDPFSAGPEIAADEHSEQAVVEIRRLVAEKNGLQQSLDEAVYQRNLAENKLVEDARALKTSQDELSKAREEADVAWELVAGQKNDRWRPISWAAGGFLIGFLISGSYGYYYSEQTRNQLLAKLQANEELIKSAAWRSEQLAAAATVNAGPGMVAKPAATLSNSEAPVKPADVITEQANPLAQQSKTSSEPLIADSDIELASVAEDLEVAAVEEKPRSWWPAGNEFSAAAAIPIERIKVALGIEKLATGEDVSAGLQQEVVAVVKDWAASWSNQDLQDYFSYYSDDYRPELGRSRSEWQEIRRSRLTKPQWIKLDLADIRLRKLDNNRIQVKLKQIYRSDFYQDQIIKSLNLIKEDGQWRILMERSLGLAGDIVAG